MQSFTTFMASSWTFSGMISGMFLAVVDARIRHAGEEPGEGTACPFDFEYKAKNA